MNTLPRNGIFELPTLPYSYEDLTPVLSKETLQVHYGRHLQTYLNNLNNLIQNSKYELSTLEEIVQNSSGVLFNNAGQVLNHIYYFTQFQKPTKENVPHGILAKSIKKQFGDFEKFQQVFEKQGNSLFGSGWVWLSLDQSQNLIISQEPNAGNPLTKNLHPILAFDVWEHAYYIDYRNQRANHLKALWSILDWERLENRYTENIRFFFENP